MPCVVDISRLRRRPDLGGKDQPGLLPACSRPQPLGGLAYAARPQPVEYNGGGRNDPGRSLSLGFGELQLAVDSQQSLADRHRFGLEVHVNPAEPQQLAATETEAQRTPETGAAWPQ